MAARVQYEITALAPEASRVRVVAPPERKVRPVEAQDSFVLNRTGSTLCGWEDRSLVT
jgi:hypothetical protein